MASSVSASVVVPQATKRTHSEMSSSEIPSQQNQPIQASLQGEVVNNVPLPGSKTEESKYESKPTGYAVCKLPVSDSMLVNSNVSHGVHMKGHIAVMPSVAPHEEAIDPIKQSKKSCDVTNVSTVVAKSAPKITDEVSHLYDMDVSCNGSSKTESSVFNTPVMKEAKKAAENSSKISTINSIAPLSQATSEDFANAPDKSALEQVNTTASQSKPVVDKTQTNTKSLNSKPQLEYGEEPEKKAKVVASTSKGGGKTPEQILEYMDKTFEQRRKIITKQMPSIPELKELYPDLFTGKQLLIEFQRITKIDIDQKIQEFCVRYATAVIEMARNKKGSAPVLARWEQAKQENETLRQYWDMVTALCLLPLHFGENFVEMVLEIGEDEEVVAQGKIVPTLVARGNIFRTDEFFLIAENTIVQEFEEFTIAFASLYSSYWVFNMVYPETIENTYNYIQRCIVRQREPGSIPPVCKNFTNALLKWNKGKDGK